ncbi:MAG: Na/Pi cotransporter family protein, partial [Lachnospiraceae bacterium]|nr:Na/Pi cotransporter family protein [Lachnospiraceae bacterium]
MSITEFFTLLGGVGLFLYGMTVMSSGLQNAAGDKVRTILEHATSNKVFGIILGITVTILIQSSSATDMMVIGFVNSGLMNLGEAIAVIMGANIGTTITAQITAFDLTAFAPFLLFVGAIMYLFVKKPSTKYVGMIILGFGMLFVGVGLIKGAIKPLATSPDFASFLSTLSNPFLAVLFGLAFTALLQSSSSSTVIFQAFAVQGILDYKTAVFLVIGAAIGSVTPNLLAGLTANRNGKRTSILNLCFNLIRAGILALIITIFPGVLKLIQALSPGDVGRQIANTHTIFAITAVLLIAPFSKYIIRLVERLIPELPEEARMKEGKKLLYMNTSSNMMPSIVIRQAMLECERMGIMAKENLQAAIDCFFLKDKEVKVMGKENKDFKKSDYEKEEARLAEQVRTTESIVDYLCHAITDQLIHIRPDDMSDADAFRASKLAIIATNYERISDHAMNIIEYMDRLEEQKESFSKPARKDMKRLAEATVRSVEMSIEIFSKENFTLLPEAERNENLVDDLHAELTDKHITRMMKGKCDTTAGIVFTDMSTDL